MSLNPNDFRRDGLADGLSQGEDLLQSGYLDQNRMFTTSQQRAARGHEAKARMSMPASAMAFRTAMAMVTAPGVSP